MVTNSAVNGAGGSSSAKGLKTNITFSARTCIITSVTR